MTRSQAKTRVKLAATGAVAVASLTTPRAPGHRSRAVVTASNPGRRAAPALELAPAALAPSPPASSREVTFVAQRVSRVEASSPGSRDADGQKTLRGVSLGSLASCMSDREEDLLKQRVLTAVRNRDACTSSAGTYRFVETKNLNAFSMWIERASGRGPSDRCAELNHALACLE